MVIGRTHGRIVVGYTSVKEMIRSRSCSACKNFDDHYICPFYARCRAERLPYEKPLAFRLKNLESIEKEFDLRTEEIEIIWHKM